jgi:HSP20 family protein
MNVIRFNPFAEVTTVRDQINRLFDEIATPRAESREAGPRVWAPLVDIQETENEVSVVMDVPGVSQSTIDVQLTGETLVVRGERKFERQEGRNFAHVERPYGTFQRSFTIGVPVQSDQVTATYRDGVLTITLPKAEAVKPRKVQIQTLPEGEKGSGANGGQ